ncbi:MAG: glutamine-hydrolyzing GMP synthase [Flavobacteriales bacterium]|nr:glutamine-hydrolyzing GMP synthase [Flavobacteriales bacterium]MCB9448925.1 glutamine-hydrolyzing GMP synthase [Flavobacteriales bacterium]
MHDSILILDFGSQYTQLIARRVRELNVYCEIVPFNNIPDFGEEVRGVILSGSPSSVRDNKAPAPDLARIRGRLPLLGICYGAQWLAQSSGGEVTPSENREYGRANLTSLNDNSSLLKGMTVGSQVWMSHADTIRAVPDSFETLASTPDVAIAAFGIKGETTFGIQFHPEVTHSTEGLTLLRNFVVDVCGCKQDWTPESYIGETEKNLRKQLGSDKVVLGLSGGVDSTVAAGLLNRAIGENLYCIFVDNGLLRKNEFEDVLTQYKKMGLNVKGVDARDRFLHALKGISDPEQKRKIIGRVFIEVFDEEAHAIQDVKWLGQGTIYPDVIESVSVKGPSATIKSHHNVGGLPDYMKLKIVEPLRFLFKDEVRNVGKSLGLPEDRLGRHPFPGPGLAIRILGEVTPEKVSILQEVDHIFISGLVKHNLYNTTWQAGAIFLPVQSVGVMGDERTYENVVCLRAVTSVDGMTADWCHLPYEFLGKISNEIINKVKGVNRVVYDISSKPPATIEWE